MAAAAQPEVQSVDPTLVYNLPLSEYYLVLDVRSREDWLRGTQRFCPNPSVFVQGDGVWRRVCCTIVGFVW